MKTMKESVATKTSYWVHLGLTEQTINNLKEV